MCPKIWTSLNPFGGDTLKKAICIRPDPWLSEMVKQYAAVHNLIDAAGHFNFTMSLHNSVKEMREKLSTADRAIKDAATWKAYAENLQKEVKPFPCTRLDEKNMTIQACYNCQDQARHNPEGLPPQLRNTILDCPRVRGTV
jgi:hypothetical protein